MGEFPREWGCRDPGAWERGWSNPALGLAHPEPAAVPRTFHLPGWCPGKSTGTLSSCDPVGLIPLHLSRVGKKVLKISSFSHISGI